VNCFEDSRVSAAPTDLGVHPRKDLIARGLRRLIQEGDGSHDHARGAKAALHRALVCEGLLDRMQLPLGAQAFYGCDGGASGVLHRDEAGMIPFTIDEHDAGPALSFPAAIFSAGESKVLTQDLEQRALGVSSYSMALAVDGEGKSFVHKPVRQFSLRGLSRVHKRKKAISLDGGIPGNRTPILRSV
jgi:hypothetical protein